VEELNKLVPSIRSLIAEIRGIKGATVEVGTQRVPVDQITDDHMEELAASVGS
jgi:hypothetical protein